jgi:hypothetical protein
VTELHRALSARVAGWPEDGCSHDRFPAIAEILGYACEDDETLQLRLVDGTRHVAELYERCFELVTDRWRRLA